MFLGVFGLILHTVSLADVDQAALITVWLRPCCTDLPAMVHQTMTEITALFPGDQFPEFHLYFFGIFCVMYQSDPVYDPDAMRISHDRRFAKYVSHDQIGTFPSNSWQL